MPANIFLSHAGADILTVKEIASLLRKNNLEVLLDHDELKTGDSFISFMNGGLEKCDYCLLLWSKAASGSEWVRAEWEAAFHRTIKESKSFLVVGRLENFPVPELLRPRLRLDFFPEFISAIKQLVVMWQNDQAASTESSRLLVNVALPVPDDPFAKTIYFSSESWGKTLPLKVNLDLPIALILEQLVLLFDLPRQLDHGGKMGVRFIYELFYDEQTLSASKSLCSQGVKENNLVWLQTTMQPFSLSDPISGGLTKSTYRGNDQSDLIKSAQRMLMGRVKELGLGF